MKAVTEIQRDADNFQSLFSQVEVSLPQSLCSCGSDSQPRFAQEYGRREEERAQMQSSLERTKADIDKLRREAAETQVRVVAMPRVSDRGCVCCRSRSRRRTRR